ncbi:class D sortase [Metabacillus fastidiosus]|uniref:class D sortase n=1 Tax=Metabacillus fastidiosus TaxID=1458 RepID=UPI002E1C116B|nr:class D sortase [Metabacillus fastidiosus]
MRSLSIVFMAAGIFIVGFACFKIFDSQMQTSESLEKAKEMMETSSNTNIHMEKVQKFELSAGEAVGILEIPRLEAKLPIVEGTDNESLEKGVGHYTGSYYPGENGQIVLSGHRDTVFRGAGKLKNGDELILQLPYGKFFYEIIDTEIVDKDDRSIITLQNDEEELILTTCYPFTYVGNAPERYIIYAKKSVL